MRAKFKRKIDEKAQHTRDVCEHLDLGHPCPSGLRPALRASKMAILPFCEEIFRLKLAADGRFHDKMNLHLTEIKYGIRSIPRHI
jgi:hypothetical protein